MIWPAAGADGLHDADLVDLLIEQGGEGVGDEEAAQEQHQEPEHDQHRRDGLHINAVGVVVLRRGPREHDDGLPGILDRMGHPVGDLPGGEPGRWRSRTVTYRRFMSGGQIQPLQRGEGDVALDRREEKPARLAAPMVWSWVTAATVSRRIFPDGSSTSTCPPTPPGTSPSWYTSIATSRSRGGHWPCSRLTRLIWRVSISWMAFNSIGCHSLRRLERAA